jgi:hypothetical protein
MDPISDPRPFSIAPKLNSKTAVTKIATPIPDAEAIRALVIHSYIHKREPEKQPHVPMGTGVRLPNHGEKFDARARAAAEKLPKPRDSWPEGEERLRETAMKDARMRSRKKHEERDYDATRNKGALVDAARRKVVHGVTDTIFRNVVAANPDRPTYDRVRHEVPRDYDAPRKGGRRVVRETTEAIFRNVRAQASRPDFVTTGVPGPTRAQRKKAVPASPVFVGDVPNFSQAYWPEVPDIHEVRSNRPRGMPRAYGADGKREAKALVKNTVSRIFSNVLEKARVDEALAAEKLRRAKARRPALKNPTLRKWSKWD